MTTAYFWPLLLDYVHFEQLVRNEEEFAARFIQVCVGGGDSSRSVSVFVILLPPPPSSRYRGDASNELMGGIGVQTMRKCMLWPSFYAEIKHNLCKHNSKLRFYE